METADVWDITVPGVECFALENGAVVHNSADAFRYTGVVKKLSFLLDKEEPKAKRVMEIPSMNNQFQLDALWEQRERDLRNRRV